jgi:glycosyl hydrolase family 38
MFFLAACTRATPALPLTHTPTPTPSTMNLDPETQALIARADRVAFIIPFSHWDTDWHEAFPDYVKRSDGNILAAIRMAKENPRFRYTFEQVLFVQHFWDAYPEYRADLKALVQNRQLTFAWAGITQPETSLVAPAIQVRNLQLGQDWITETFGVEYVPHTAWQSDAFGNSAAFPTFLAGSGIPYLFIGRWQNKCDPDYADCTPLPHAFYWKSPATGARVLVAYLSYPNAWDAIHRLTDEGAQVAALRQYVETQFARTDSKYVFIPMGSDFIDPLPNLQSLISKWNAADPRTALVIADPETAFQYLATQPLPEFDVDLNPIWQAFYASRPFAKIADKESEYFLTAADKFGLLMNAPSSSAWYTATVSAHYDNISAVSFDAVWESTQRPRFEQTLATAAGDLTSILTRIAGGVDAPVLLFNPSSWARSEIIEINATAGRPGLDDLPAPVQTLGPGGQIAFRAASVPPIGYAPPASDASPLVHPAGASRTDDLVTLTNGLVAVTLDPAHGGAISNLSISNQRNLVSDYADDVAYWNDTGDIYGASFKDERARESETTAQITVLAGGPLVARAQVAFTLGGQPLTKTVTIRADDPLIEVALEIKALPETSAVLHIPTAIEAEARTDDLGFAAFTHPVDNRPIAPGDRTYRREIFYPVTYWSDVSDASGGLTLITHGLQAVGGTSHLSLLLVRQVTEEEGLSDPDYHTLRYAYLPHIGQVTNLPQIAYAFNQPLIPVWRSGDQMCVQLPFQNPSISCNPQSARSNFPQSLSLLSAQSGLVADLYRRGDQVEALVLDDDPATPATLLVGDERIALPGAALTLTPVELALPVASR